MYLTQTEEDRLLVFMAAQLARRSRADGVKLNAPEATALICDEMHRAARRGAPPGQVLAAGRAAVRREELMDGVPALIGEIRLEVLVGDGARLVVLRDPWGPPTAEAGVPGEVRSPEADIALNAGRPRRRLRVASRSDHPVRVSSHYPFWRVNARLEFDRQAAAGCRLDIPAGASVRWAPGEVKTVDLVAFAGGGG